ncbi:hypothetical protein [Pelagerythrobacter aerophilus]|uniref:hypothetical protein n=1 Tax=Pelagerythrobacter aerophilus TaxID=2306995 RepID=UPI0011C39B63|nr:hypothetical protein [Pelagerythrobacter aerophilus]
MEADHCSEVLPRVLGIGAQQSLIPSTIAYECEYERLRIEVDIGGLEAHTGALLAARIERIISVRSVELVAGLAPPSPGSTNKI